MTNRLSVRFDALREANRAGFVGYIMGGDPDWDSALAIANTLIHAGVDILELGFPFTDPMADGPAIQAAADRALKAGASLKTTLSLAGSIRAANPETPLVLMGYLNPVEQMGAAAFAANAAQAGVDGVILVDLPPEEDAGIRTALAGHGVALIRLATPTTDETRLLTVLKDAAGFVYYVSVAGVTGQKAAPAQTAGEAALRLKTATTLPIAVGFGVRDADAAKAIALSADAVVVGSALVERIAAGAVAGLTGQALANTVGELAQTLADAVHLARQGP